ncbi:putative manganese-dependent inorganic diphosphatase [Treponema zuelzerae]|uniref:inorganic diphosphatase n=1 Tax=Teretinema zuelzerae TaxID=156 RepID=A0AAE3EIQ9_9SPIR|nr:putative manganese-dependent inorganic diphosphatase [Teretinema zuelzerae]MCD1655464.1 putative manganese-dependent inorganic diphosphatase [Teretinema zuelzerae]
MKPNTHQRRVYIIGHRNPDTDSVVSAAAYAALKQAQGQADYHAARAGKPTPQTEYIFNRFKVPLPEFLADLVPKVAYHYKPNIRTIGEGTSLWEAMEVLEKNEIRALPVVDGEGRYHSLLHYSSFAQKILKMINPQQKTVIQTSIDLLSSVLHTQALVVRNEKEVRKSPIVIAAAEFDTFKEHLGAHIPANTIVITGNRKDIQEHAIESGVRALIITNGNMISKELRSRAEERDVSVLISPYDTASTALLIIYSMPVTCMSNAAVKPVSRNDTTRKVAPLLANSPGKSLPVVDDSGAVIGVISESDLYGDPNIELIMVDHNEQSQAIEGVEHYRILEIIDHHRLGNPPSREPITFINKPVGATSTIITTLYQEQRIPIRPEIASILLCGILADTLVLQSATTTQIDRSAAEYLSNITNLDIETLGKDLLNAASNISGRTEEDLIGQDMKEYAEGEYSFTVSQIEVEDPHEILGRKKAFIENLEARRQRGGHLFSALLVTDITELSSLLLVAGDSGFEQSMGLPKMEDSVYVLRDVVSRKKQLMPILSEITERFRDER